MKIAFNFFESFLLLFIQLFLIGGLTMPQEKDTTTRKEGYLKITIIYDNYQMKKGLETDWGFSCMVDIDEIKLLFDTGESGKILLSNMTKLNIDPESIDFIFLSHFHHDHTGGLNEFLKKNSNVTIYYPQSFPNSLVKKIKNSGAKLIPISSFQELLPNTYSLGELDGSIREQSLAVRTSKGIIVITGCAHPGIINILETAKSFFPNEKVYFVLGGFHLYRKTEDEINNTISKILNMGIENVAPSHCSGNTARNKFKEVYNNNYIEIGTGKSIRIE